MAPSESLRVVINARPLLASETAHSAASCLVHSPDPPTVALLRPPAAPHVFRAFDAVYPPDTPSLDPLYHAHVAPLVDSLYRGLNATVFAYGQTSAGKSHTMSHVTRLAARHIFALRADAQAAGRNVTVRVGFVEIYKENIRDLVDGAGAALGAVSVTVRERCTKGRRVVFLDGARERCVGDEANLMAIIREGALVRRTAATGMNASSSRSHSVITITVQQEGPADGACLAAKLHLVDLAGSERAKRTKVTGERFAEGVDINRGLFALAKVISALADNAAGAKRHVPYRDSKLTRLLQDSLGGNARTLLIACVSPADTSREETLGTLRYAERAKSIRNRPTVNTEPGAVEISDLRAALARARAEIASLAAENDRLRRARTVTPASSVTSSRPPSPTRDDALIVMRDDVVVSGLRYRIAELEGQLAKQRGRREGVGLASLTNVNDRRARERRPKRRARPLKEVGREEAARGIGARSASAGVLPRRTDDPHQQKEEAEAGAHAHAHANDDDDDEGSDGALEARVVDVRSATRIDEMRRTFTERLRQAENDKAEIDDERVRLLRRLRSMQSKHEKEIDDLKSGHSTRLADMRGRLADVRKLEAESTRLAKLRDGSDAARKKLMERVKTVEKARDEVVSRLAEAVVRTETVKRGLGKENRDLARSERLLRGDVARLESGRLKQDAVISRLRMENEALKGRLRELGRGHVRRANSGFTPSSRAIMN